MRTSQAQSKIPVRYDFSPGHVLARKYEVLSRVGSGRSGELYMLSEQATGIERTAKFFYPHVDPVGRLANNYAMKLHRLRHCDILLPYRTQETISVGGRDVTFLVSDFVRGEPLAEFLKRQPGGRLATFEALHLLHALATGVEKLHAAGEHHGELGADSLLVQRKGLGFQVKLIDLSHEAMTCAQRGRRTATLQDDVYELLRIFYAALGGARAYARQPRSVKSLCLGLKRQALRECYRDAGELRRTLETLRWS